MTVTEPLRVLVDATSIPPSIGGVGRYLQHLVPALALRDSLEVVVVCQQRDAGWFAASAPSARIVPLPPRSAGRLARLVWEQVGLGRLARREGARVIHSPHYTMSVFARTPSVVTLHDATFFSHPELHSRLKRLFFRTWTRYSVRRAAVCIVPSIATGAEERRYAGLPAAREVVAYHGVDTTLFSPPTAEDVAATAKLLSLPAGGWLSFLGTVEPRKNIPNLVRAYSAIAVRGAAASTPVPPLVIAGAKGWDEETAGVIASLPTGVDVRFAGYVPAENLAGLLGGSTVFIYPSLGEGFGLPVLEAMACAAPTLTTRELALPEVGGEAVAYCGTSAHDIEWALELLLFDADRRARLATAGPLRAAEFTWARSASDHERAYRLALTT
jgi:glycosyltransferase involved in cell wall biosynthesis